MIEACIALSIGGAATIATALVLRWLAALEGIRYDRETGRWYSSEKKGMP